MISDYSAWFVHIVRPAGVLRRRPPRRGHRHTRKEDRPPMFSLWVSVVKQLRISQDAAGAAGLSRCLLRFPGEGSA